MMEKRSPKSPLAYERYKSRCAWSFVRWCDFEQDDSGNRKLVSDGKGLKSRVSDELDITNRLDFHFNSSGSKFQGVDSGVNKRCQMIDSSKADVIGMMDGEMASELQVNKKITNTKGQHVPSNTQFAGPLPSNQKRKPSKSFRVHGCKDIATTGHGQLYNESSVDKSSTKGVKAASTQAQPRTDSSCGSVSHTKDNQHLEKKIRVQMNEAVEGFINKKFNQGKFVSKMKASHQSKHFLDALEILNSNKELFMNLLQDPNSVLVKHIQDLRHSQTKKPEIKSTFAEARLSENCGTRVRESKECGFNQVTMQNSAGDTSDCVSPQSLHSLRDRVQHVKPAYFSFGLVKRKLRSAIGLSRNEKKHCTSTDLRHKSPCGTQASGDDGKARATIQSNSLSKCNHEIGQASKSSLVKKGDHMCKMKGSESGNKEQVAESSGTDTGNSTLSTVRPLKQSEVNKYLEYRNRLPKAIRSKNEDFSRTQFVMDSRKILSLPEYDFLSAVSLERHRDYGFNVSQMRYSPYSYYQIVNEKKETKNKYSSSLRQLIEAPSLADYNRFIDQLQTSDKEPNEPGNRFPDVRRHERVCSLNNHSSFAGSVYTTTVCGENSCLRVPSDSQGVHNSGSNPSTGPVKTYKNNEDLMFLKLDSLKENFTSPSSEDAYSSSPLSMKRLENFDGMKDKAEHASPVSPLDQLFVEEINSPLCAVSQSSEPAAEPKQDDYEEHYPKALLTAQDLKINSTNVMDEHESMYRYTTAVLQASGIKWEELPTKCHSSDKLLEPSLLDGMEVLPIQFTGDQELLFDYINELVIEVYQCYFSCSPWVSLLYPKVQQVHSGTNVVNEVMKTVDFDILFRRQFQTLEQLVGNDLAKSRATWMETRIDAEAVVTELADIVLEELALEISTGLHN